MKIISIVLLSTLLFSCSPKMHRGSLAILSTEPVESRYTALSKQRVSGRACFNQAKGLLMLGDGVFDASLQDALSKTESATVLLSVEYKDTGSCIVVSGIPAKET